MKIHGGSKVASARAVIEDALAVAVDVLHPTGDPAPDQTTVSSIRDGGAAGTFAVPKANVLVGNIEESFFEHFGFRINVLLPDGNPAADDATLGTIRRLHQRSRTDLPPLAAWFGKALEEKGTTLSDVANKSGLSEATLQKIRLGTTLNPQDRTVQKIEDALGLKVPQDIVEEVEQEAQIAGVGELIDFDPYVKDDIPNLPGIYVLYDLTDRPVYVGKSESSIRTRVTSGHSDKKWFVRPFVESGAYVQIDDKDLLAKVERLLIRFLKSNAMLNSQHVDRGA